MGVGAGGWATAKQKDTGTTFKKFEESDLPEGFVKLERVVETLENEIVSLRALRVKDADHIVGLEMRIESLRRRGVGKVKELNGGNTA